METLLFYVLFGVVCLIIGAFPTGYIIVKISKSDNVFAIGNGNPGLNNIKDNLGGHLSVMLGITDFIVKIIIPRFILFTAAAYQIIDSIPVWLILYGMLWVIIGNSWSMFSKFKGGRSIYILFTSLLVLDFSAWMWVLGIPIVRKIFKIDSAPIALVGITLLFVYYWGDTNEMVVSSLIISVIALKRVVGNGVGTTLKKGNHLRLLVRLIYDRDERASNK